MNRVHITFVCLLALGLPAFAQDSDTEQTKRIEELIEELGDEEFEARQSAASALGGIGSSAAPALVAVLADEDRGDLAAVVLIELGPIAIPALLALLSVELEDHFPRDWGTRHWRKTRFSEYAAHILHEIDAPAVSALATALSDEHASTRKAAAISLMRLGPKAAPAVPTLTATLSDSNKDVRAFAAHALSRIGPKAAPAVPALTAALSDSDEDLRSAAACALGGIGSQAASAVSSLAAAASGPTALDARSALHEIGSGLKAQGTLLYWVVPCVYWKQLIGLLLLLVGWFALATRFPKQRPISKLKQVALFAITAIIPVALACSAVGYAVTRYWAQSFLPDPVLTVLPFPVTAVLSMGFLCVLAAVWACWRKPAVAEATAG